MPTNKTKTTVRRPQRNGQKPRVYKLRLYVAGQTPKSIRAFANLKAVLQAGGASMDELVKLNVTIGDDMVRDAVNAQWLAHFPNPNDRPARHIVVQPLQHGMRLQLEALAVIR